jgi:hypothetical protein
MDASQRELSGRGGFVYTAYKKLTRQSRFGQGFSGRFQ